MDTNLGNIGWFLIQIEHQGQQLDMTDVCNLLDGTGVDLDVAYGPILVNPSLGRYVVRGAASDEARAKAEEIPGVQFFGDIKQQAVRQAPPAPATNVRRRRRKANTNDPSHRDRSES